MELLLFFEIKAAPFISSLFDNYALMYLMDENIKGSVQHICALDLEGEGNARVLVESNLLIEDIHDF